MGGMRSFEYELHKTPFRAEWEFVYRRRQRAGAQPNSGQPCLGALILLARPYLFQEAGLDSTWTASSPIHAIRISMLLLDLSGLQKILALPRCCQNRSGHGVQ